MLTVIVALTANALIALAKSIVAGITGSASMVAEAAHSWADTGNELFLLMAERRGARPRDKSHLLGYGRDSYVWSMFAAFGLFSAGSVLSIWNGIQGFSAQDEGDPDYTWAYVVLAVAFVLEGISFLQARRETRAGAAKFGLRPLRYITQTSNPTLRAVFFEDAAALTGLVIAALGVGLHQITGDARWDAVGSILVGLLLGVLAIFLISRNRDFLVGQQVGGWFGDQARTALHQMPEVEDVTFFHMEFVGPLRVFIVAAVDLTGNRPESEVAAELRRIEERLESLQTVERAIITVGAPA